MRKGNIQKNSTLKDYYGKDASPLLFKKLYLFDMDGTIYLGNRLFPGVKELLAKITARGGKTVFITNNASKSVGDYVEKLHRLGLENVTEDNFFTSAQAAVRLMKERHASDLIYVQGTRSFVRECLEGGTEYHYGIRRFRPRDSGGVRSRTHGRKNVRYLPDAHRTERALLRHESG